jgi:hypothetical protein
MPTVILVGRVDYDPIMGYRGTSAEVFPGLADAVAQQQFLGKLGQSDDPKAQSAVRRESDEVAWLLGVQFAVQVVVGDNNEVIDVLAGSWSEVQKQGQRALDRCWRRKVPRRADLVIATIRGDSAAQGFDVLGRALANARELVVPGGLIAVLSNLSALPGPMLKSVASGGRTPPEIRAPSGGAKPSELSASSVRKLTLSQRNSDRLPPLADAVSTWQIVQACRHARVYLLSRLSTQLVQDLSITPLGSLNEVQQLINESASCIILDDAAFVHATVEVSDAEPTR